MSNVPWHWHTSASLEASATLEEIKSRQWNIQFIANSIGMCEKVASAIWVAWFWFGAFHQCHCGNERFFRLIVGDISSNFLTNQHARQPPPGLLLWHQLPVSVISIAVSWTLACQFGLARHHNLHAAASPDCTVHRDERNALQHA